MTDDAPPTFPNGYDANIPEQKRDLFQSGLSGQKETLSSLFDIQYRSYSTREDPQVNNGSPFVVGSFRQLGSLVLDDTIEAVEELIANTIDGGVAFRNHTLPMGVPLGAVWSEDLLVMEPETQCVNTNLTIDFTLLGLNGTSMATWTVW